MTYRISVFTLQHGREHKMSSVACLKHENMRTVGVECMRNASRAFREQSSTPLVRTYANSRPLAVESESTAHRRSVVFFLPFPGNRYFCQAKSIESCCRLPARPAWKSCRSSCHKVRGSVANSLAPGAVYPSSISRVTRCNTANTAHTVSYVTLTSMC